MNRITELLLNLVAFVLFYCILATQLVTLDDYVIAGRFLQLTCIPLLCLAECHIY
jgi:hypothetical protein